MVKYWFLWLVATLACAAPVVASAQGVSLPRTFDILSTQADRYWDRATFEAQVLNGQAPTGQEADLGGTIHYIYQFDDSVSGVRANYSEFPGYVGTTIDFMALDFSHPYLNACLTFRKASADLVARGWHFSTFENTYPFIKSDFQRDGMDLKIGNLRLPPFPEPSNPPGSNPQEEQAERDRANLTPGDKAYGDLCVDRVDVSFVRG